MRIYFFLLVIFCSCESMNQEFQYRSADMRSTINTGAIISCERTEDIHRNDLIVYKDDSTDEFKCLRVIGICGDKIEIIKGRIYVNDTEFVKPETGEMLYKIVEDNSELLQTLRIYDYGGLAKNRAIVSIPKHDYDSIMSRKIFDSIIKFGADTIYDFPSVIRTSDSKYFNHYYFGPIKVPKVGEKLDVSNLRLINPLNRKCLDDDSIVMDNLYFCLGDNFLGAIDSRELGLVPFKKIEGKVIRIKNTKVLYINR